MNTLTAEEKLEQFLANHPTRTYSQNDLIVSPLEKTECVYIINEGTVRVFTIRPKGKVWVLTRFKKGHCFPFWALADLQNPHYYEAVGETTLYQIKKVDLQDFLFKNPDVYQLLMKRVLSLGLEFIIQAEIFMTEPLSKKLTHLLLYLSQNYSQRDGLMLRLDVNHRLLSAWLGTTREVVSRQFGKLKSLGIVDVTGKKIVIRDLEKLKQLDRG